MIIVFVGHMVHVALGTRSARDFGEGVFWGPELAGAAAAGRHRHGGAMLKWFCGLGPRPQFDRFTYWEKFDYWAVFWGMFIIGGSGLLLWFPMFFSTFLPGWVFNVATLVHGEEALLAVVFIFTIHFFNGHLRPEKFPMDTVIFTGRMSDDELRHERPVEYARLHRDGRLAARSATADSGVARVQLVRRWRLALGSWGLRHTSC